MDAPLHFGKDKWSVDEIPVEHFVDRPLIVINAEHSVIKNRDYQITEADLLAWEQENGRIPEGAVIFLRTGMSKHYSNRQRYFGVSGGSISRTNIHVPGLHAEAAEWIVRNRLIVGIGIDAISLDAGQSKGFVSHQTVLNRNMYILENLNDKIDQIPVTGAKVHVFPMKIEGASGAPVRVVVDINSGSHLTPFMTLITICITLFTYIVF
jgi:kynurenine formamidase